MVIGVIGAIAAIAAAKLAATTVAGAVASEPLAGTGTQGGTTHREAQGAVLPFAWAAEIRALQCALHGLNRPWLSCLACAAPSSATSRLVLLPNASSDALSKALPAAPRTRYAFRAIPGQPEHT
jgi:hypothetical protein